MRKAYLIFMLAFVICSYNVFSAITDNLIAYYSGDVNGNFSDSTRIQPDGKMINTPKYIATDGAFNTAFYNFSSVATTKINIGAGFKSVYTSMSWGGFFNQDKVLADNFPFDGHNGANQGFFIRYNLAGSTADCVIAGSGSEATAQTAITNDVWQHITCVWNGSRIAVYKNGVYVTSTAKTTYTANSGNTSIGSYPTAALHFNGGIDNIYFYNRSLSLAEIVTINNTAYPFTTSTCTYSGSGNWNINCADNCVIATPTNLVNNDIVFNGAGDIWVNAAFTGVKGMYNQGTGCRVNIRSTIN